MCLGAALMAVLIYRQRNRQDNTKNFSQMADIFEDLAVEILNKFYHEDPVTCAKAITRQIPSYGQITWVQVAIQAEAKHFFSQRAIQEVLNHIWSVRHDFYLRIHEPDF